MGKGHRGLRGKWAILAGGALLSTAALAQDEGAGASPSPLDEGPYLAPMGQYVLTDDEAFDDGYGGVFAAGYRRQWWAVEASGLYGRYGGDVGDDTDVIGGTINGLVFPFAGLPNLFGLIGAGGLDVDQHPEAGKEYSLTTIEGGLGYLFALAAGNYDFAIRADARYRYGHRESKVEPQGDIDVANDFKDVLINLGLQLPLGFREPPPPPPPPPPVAVVPVADSDGDGVLDDVDQCPNTPASTPVNDKGCPLPPPCKTPGPGERISLGGCGTGDVIVLRGVNFEFDKSVLDVNAKTILDNVAEELKAYPDITIELSGHTDSKGSDAYNQRLSEARASSVKTYLVGAGIAEARMTTVGHGESKPVADNETDEGRELNRRVELTVTAGVAGAAAPAPSPAEPAAADAPAPPVPADAAPAALAEPPPADAPSAAAAVSEEPPEPSAEEILPPAAP